MFPLVGTHGFKIKDQEKIEYYNDGLVRWAGLFGQIEYKKDNLSAFMQFWCFSPRV